MPAIETFYTAAAVVLFALGAVHCVLPRSFRLGVVLMLLGDACFAVAIAFPKKVLELFADVGVDLTAFPADLTVAGGLFALLLSAAVYVLFIRCFKLRPFWKKNLTPPPQNEGQAKSAVAGEKRAAAADPPLFKNVKIKAQHES